MKRIITILSCSVIILFLFSISLFSQTTKRIYLIGNSVTDGVEYDGFEKLALERGNTHVYGHQMIPGAPLGLLWSSSSGFTTSPYGPHSDALPNYTWDAISLQPFDRSLVSDSLHIGYFIDEAKTQSPGVQIYIMSRHPRKPVTFDSTAIQWNELWMDTYSGGMYQYNEVKSFFENLVDTVRYNNTDVPPALMVPVGDVMYAMNNKLATYNIDGYNSIWAFYADGIHMLGIGKYIYACTYFATIYKQDPRGLSVPSQFGSIPDALRDTIQQTVFEVVFNHPYSGATMDDLIPADGVSVSPGSLALNMLQTSTVTATVSPIDAANKQVTWVSRNTGIATVKSDGRVTGVGNGTTYIVATSNDGGFMDSCEVTVTGSISGTTTSGTLVAWDFDGITEEDSVTATTVMSGISGTVPSAHAIAGDGVVITDYTGNGFYVKNQSSLTLTEALASNEYISFTVTPEAGGLITIDTLFYRGREQNNRKRIFAVFSSVKGFTEGQEIQIDTSAWSKIVYVPVTGHTNIGESVEFRIYIYGYDNVYESVGIFSDTGNDVFITGDLTVPSDSEPPTIPGNLTSNTIKAESLFLSWDESTDNMAVMGYNIYQDNIKLNSELVTEMSYYVSGLTAGTSYDFEVKAEDFLGNESDPATLTVMTNRQPTAVITASPTSGAAPLTVDFNANSSTDPDSEDYILGFEWDFGDGSETELSNNLQHIFTSEGEYTVSLRVMDNRDFWSESVTTTISVSAGEPDTEDPSAPSGLASSNITATNFDISWTASTDNIGVTGYDVYIDGSLNQSVTITSASISGLTAETMYTVTIVAKDAAGNESSPSSGLEVTTSVAPSDTEAPSVPTGLSSSNVTITGFNISWTASTDNVGVTGYDVMLDGSFNQSVAGTSASFSGLTAATQYMVTVIANDAAGNKSVASSGLYVTTLSNADTEAPTSPDGLASANITKTSFDISWNASTDNIAVTEYDVYLNGSLETSVASNSANISGLSEATVYTVTIIAKDAAGNESAASTVLNVTTLHTGITGYCGQINIYPVPANNELNISAIFVIESVKVLDLSGKVLIVENTNVKSHTLDVSGLSEGLYLLELNFESKVNSLEKIIIQ